MVNALVKGNLLVNKDGKRKIADFGEAVQQIGDNDLQLWWTYCKARGEFVEALESGDSKQSRWWTYQFGAHSQ